MPASLSQHPAPSTQHPAPSTQHPALRLESAPVLPDQLHALINARLAPDADVDAIDRRIWELYGETWCIMATDLSGFSRGVAKFGIVHFLQTIVESERLFVPIVEAHDGILLKIEGDSFFVIFRDPRKALHAALEMQYATRRYNENRSPEEQVLLGIGLGYGPVLRISDADVYGNEVNSACILGETHARPYEILVTRSLRDAVVGEFEPFEPVPPGAGGAYRVLYSGSVVE
jgi:adenylate cyclase